MSKSLIDLLAILDIEPLEENLFRGVSPKTDGRRPSRAAKEAATSG